MKIIVRSNRLKIKGDISIGLLLEKTRSGFEMLTNINWVSAYGAPLSVAGVLGAVGLHFALRDGRLEKLSNFLLLSDGNSSSEKLLFVPGLRNLGNNCFLNVVLQSLASCSSFKRYLDEIQDLQLMSNGDQVDDLPLLMSLADLLEEMSGLEDRSRSLNPQKVMSAMHDYIPQFQLTNQQDAEEALLHLISCLREELAYSFKPNCGSLADVDAPTSRIFSLKMINNVNELRRWQQQYLGPFDGVLSSSLTCHTCSSEIILDFGFFHSLPLSLNPNNGSFVLGRFTLENCIQRFLSSELVDYSCSHCWHIAASRYLTSMEGKQEEICKLRDCVEQDSCDCKNLSSLQALPWSNRFSQSSKQLYIARFPQILCLHLQRTSMNAFGELMKIQDHISFPLNLDLSPFAKHEFGIHKRDVNESKIPRKQLFPSAIYNTRIFDRHLDPTTTVRAKGEAPQPSPQQQSSPQLGTSLDNTFMRSDTDKVAYDSVPSKTQLYRLVSVVEHFGKAGSGHYTVYRGVRSQIGNGDVDGGINILPLQWFRISDVDVYHASEEDVLTADASLLFYERI